MFELLSPETAQGDAQALLQATQKQLGRVPNLYRAMANGPTALKGYLDFRQALQGGALSALMRERIALLTAELNECDYCVAAHMFRGAKIGIPAEDLNETRAAASADPKTHAALRFVAALIDKRGHVDDAAREAVFAQGWTEAEVAEMVAHVALNVFSNYFKQVAQPALDFPAVEALR